MVLMPYATETYQDQANGLVTRLIYHFRGSIASTNSKDIQDTFNSLIQAGLNAPSSKIRVLGYDAATDGFFIDYVKAPSMDSASFSNGLSKAAVDLASKMLNPAGDLLTVLKNYNPVALASAALSTVSDFFKAGAIATVAFMVAAIVFMYFFFRRG